MPNLLAQLNSLQGSYSGAFVLLWGLCIVLTGVSLVIAKRRWVGKFNAGAYWLLASLMVAFAALRPIGIARDDLAYLEIFNGICPTLTCHQWIQGARDWGWYSLVGLIKSFWADPRLMVWLGAAGLLVKFGVIYRLARQPLLALVLFAGLFYQVLDLTAWRIALASTVFMLGFMLLVEGRSLVGGLVTLASGVFHKQAFVTALMLPAPWLMRHYAWLLALVVCPVLLMIAGWYPDIPAFAQQLGADSKLSAFVIQQGLDAYIGKKAANAYIDWRIAPVVYYPLLALALWLARDAFVKDRRLYAYSSICIAWAAWFLWGFASLPDAQVRFFDFMVLPVVFLAGACRLDWWRFAGVVAISGMFVVKYNILHPLLTGEFVF